MPDRAPDPAESTAAAAEPAPARTETPLWRNEPLRAERNRRRGLAVALGSIVLALGGLAYLLTWISPVPRPSLITVEAAPDLAPIPQRAGDRRAEERLAAFTRIAGRLDGSPDAALLGSAVAERSAEWAGQTLVLNLVARPWVGKVEGKVQVLIPEPGRAFQPGEVPVGIPLRAVVEAITGPPKLGGIAPPEQRPAPARVLVLLDLHPPLIGPGLPAVTADIGALVALEAARLLADHPNLAILAAVEPGQQPGTAPALGRSAFAYYVELGLRGAADASGDQRLTVAELASFVRDRVARWSLTCRGIPQTPRLYQRTSAADFAIVAVGRTIPAGATLPKAPPVYPQWLKEAWLSRDARLGTGDNRLAPRPLGQFEAAILQAEHAWIDGGEEKEIRPTLRDQLDRLGAKIAANRSIPHPRLRSLALERTFGATDDPALIQAVRDLVAQRTSPTPDAQPAEAAAADARTIAGFLAKQANPTDFALASAIIQVAASTSDLTAETVVWLDQVLAARQPEPLYTETYALRRLARQPRRPDGWRPERAGLRMNLTLQTEAVQSRLAAPDALLGLLTDADGLRHKAEALGELVGFADPAEADRLLVSALAAMESCLVRVNQVERARRVLDESARLAPAAIPLLGLDTDRDQTWLRTSQLAETLIGEELAGRLGPDADSLVDALAATLGPWRAPALHQRIAPLIDPANRLEPADWGTIAALLASPLPVAADRAALWKAQIDLDRRLTGAVLKLDERDGRAVAATAGSEPPPWTDAAILDGRSARHLNRVANAVARLEGPTPPPETASDQQKLIHQEREGRLLPAWATSRLLDDPATNPTRVRRLDEWRSLQRWLHARYQFESFDPIRSDFFAAAAQDYAGPDPPARRRLTFAVAEPDLRVNPKNPSQRLTFTLGQSGEPGQGGDSAQVNGTTPDPGSLSLTPRSVRDPVTQEARMVPLDSGWPVAVAPVGGECSLVLSLPAAAATVASLRAGQEIRGVLIRAFWEGRTYHFPVPVRVESAADRLRPFLTADPEPTARSVPEVSLRPPQGKTAYHLQVKNPANRVRTVHVRLSDRRGLIAEAPDPLTIPAGATAQVSFGAAVPDLEPGMVPIRPPLTVQVADADHPAEAVVLPVPVRLVRPTDLVQILSARYDPAVGGPGGKSRLEIRLRAVEPLAGPPCALELVLPAGRIPGLLGSGEGTFRGLLPRPGEELTLFAEDLRLDERADEAGVVYLSIDGVERALVFRARFARRGRPTSLILDGQPALRLQGDAVAPVSGAYPLTIAIDAPPEASQILLTLGRYAGSGRDDRFEEAQRIEIEGARTRFRLNPRGPMGALVFDATVLDPTVSLDVGGIRGQRLVRADLLDETGGVVASDQLALVIDDRAASEVRFDNSPRFGVKNGTITLRVVGRVPSSGVRAVNLFVGRPTSDGKRPDGVTPYPARPLDAGRTTWEGTVPLGDAKLGPLDLSAEFVAGNGLARFATTSLGVVETIPVDPGVVRGVVKEGPRPQPNLEVRALDEKKVEKAKATTDALGRFALQGLAPGKYQIVCVRLTPPRRGATPVEVVPGKVIEVEVPMFQNR